MDQLAALAEKVRAVVAGLELTGIREWTPPPFTVDVDRELGAVVVGVSEWTEWGPRRVLDVQLERTQPRVEIWSTTIYVYPE